MKATILIIIFSNLAWAQNRTSIFKKPVEPASEVKKVVEPNQSPKKKPKNYSSDSGNLPFEYLAAASSFSIEESPIVLPQNKIGLKFNGVRPGDLVQARILESVFAFQDSKAPIRAVIQSGPLNGAVLIGEASLEKNSKRIQIEFKKFRDPRTKELFNLQASAMDEKGILGLVGELISNEGKYFAAEVIAAGAAGYADSTVSRNQNFLGNQVDVQSEDTYAKKALTSALSKTADRFSEKLKQSPEYSILEGPISIQILILEHPVLIN